MDQGGCASGHCGFVMNRQVVSVRLIFWMLTMVSDHSTIQKRSDMEEIAISKFKATCLAVLERVRKTGKTVLVTRFGEPVAEVVPPHASKRSKRRLGSQPGRSLLDVRWCDDARFLLRRHWHRLMWRFTWRRMPYRPGRAPIRRGRGSGSLIRLPLCA